MSRSFLFYSSLLFLISLITYDVYLLYLYAFDVPFWDVWDSMPKGTYTHIFDFYNENMQFFYFTISEIMYKTSNWNLRYFNFVNFAIYCLIAITYWIILIKTKPKNKVNVFPLFLCAIFTPMLGYNWLWSILVQTHTFILFFLIAIYWGFVKDGNRYSVYLFGVSLFLSVISMNIPLAMGGCIAYIIKECINCHKDEFYYCICKILKLITLLFVLFLLLSGVTDIRRFINVELSHNLLTTDYINNLSFYIVNSFSLFAFADVLRGDLNVVLLIGHFAVLLIVFIEQYKDKTKQPLWGILFGVLFCVCGVVAFRGGEVYSYDFSYIRHNETVFMLLPAMLMIMCLSKRRFIRIYSYFLVVLMIVGVVKDIQSKRFEYFGELFYKNGCLCLNHYWNLKTMKDWQCTMNFPIAHGTGMEIGKNKRLSFINTIKTCY